jgi:hypothetical protein
MLSKQKGNELVAAQEKSDFSFNFNCFSQRKAGKATRMETIEANNTTLPVIMIS